MSNLGLADFGIILSALAVFGVGALVVMGLIAAGPIIAQFVRRQWRKSMARGRAQKAARDQLYGYSVNDYQDTPPIVMSRSDTDEARTVTDGRTDEATDDDPKECPVLRLDRSKEGLLKVLVYNGWSTTDIRAVIKGANDQISAAVQAVKEDDVLITPYAGRATKRSFYPEEPELEYQAPRG
jgi:hypothetical protein